MDINIFSTRRLEPNYCKECGHKEQDHYSKGFSKKRECKKCECKEFKK